MGCGGVVGRARRSGAGDGVGLSMGFGGSYVFGLNRRGSDTELSWAQILERRFSAFLRFVRC